MDIILVSQIILIIVAISGFITAATLMRAYKSEIVQSKQNLGNPEELENVSMKLFENLKRANVFVIISFVPNKDYENATEMCKMFNGVGLIAHPDYPRNPIFCRMRFDAQYGFQVYADGKTYYEIIYPGHSPSYLMVASNN